ncbi:hypothetical protein D3C85_1120970 [compost metagenome]
MLAYSARAAWVERSAKQRTVEVISMASACRRPTHCPACTACLVEAMPIGLRRPMRAAKAWTFSLNDAFGKCSVIRPLCFARSALHWSQVSMNSSALALPIRRGSRCVPPPPAMMPTRASGWPMVKPASPTMKRKSKQAASSVPPPLQLPLIAAMVTLLLRSIAA